MKFIKATLARTKEDIFINPNSIALISPDQSGTIITMNYGRCEQILETADEILDKISQCTQQDSNLRP